MDDATLLVNLLGLQEQSVGPVVQNQQTRVDDALARRGYITYIIYRLVDRGIGVEVGSELHTDSLAPLHDIVTLEVLGTVEAHVLQEVSQSALLVILLNGAHALCDVELGTLLGPSIMTNVISQSVVQLTDFYLGVNGHCRHLLSHHVGCTSHKKHGSHQ